MLDRWRVSPLDWLETPSPLRHAIWKHLAMVEEGEEAVFVPGGAYVKDDPGMAKQDKTIQPGLLGAFTPRGTDTE